MRLKPHRPSSALIIALMTVSEWAYAADTAPVPPGFKAEATSTVPGVFALATSCGTESEPRISLDDVESACIARGRVVEYAGGSRQRIQTTWWLYRNGTETAVFRSTIKPNVDADQCRVTFEEERRVLRSTNKAGAWPSPFSAHWFMCSGRCHSETMFGIKARCRLEGDSFIASRECVSKGRGPLRGMLLESGWESDDMQGSQFVVSELMSNVPIDASLFDRSRTW